MITKIKEKIELKDFVIFFLPFLFFLIFLIIFYPGILSYDSYNQLNQIITGNYSNWHPFFHTFIEMICYKIWDSPASIALFQIVIFSILWTIICKYNRKSKKDFIFQIIITLIICLNPINYIYAITLWKDILFCYNILLVCFLLQVSFDKKFLLNNKILLLLLSVSIGTMSQLRGNGFYIAVILVIILTIIFFVKDKISKNFIKFPLFVIITIIVIMSLNVVFKVQDTEKNPSNSKVMQLIALYLKEDVITDVDDLNVISKVGDIDKLKTEYNPYFSDPIYEIISDDAFAKNSKEIYTILIKYSISNSNLLMKYALESTSIVWRIDRPSDSIGQVFNTDINSINNNLNILPKFKDYKIYQKVNLVINKTLNSKWISIVLYSPAFYMYMTLIIYLVLVLYYKINWTSIIIILPNLLNILIVAISIPVHDTRYLYGNFLIFYLLLLLSKSTVKENKE